ncbi:MAG: response regulator, partial [Candidatus Latescibacteria bacterium]|nr:response regulator [Candidatus Latescibacterota bacterium]
MSSSAGRSVRYPVGPVVLASLATVALLAWSSWDHDVDRRRFAEDAKEISGLVHASARLRHMDEALSLSANLAAATGDEKWIDRYHEARSELDRLLAETSRHVPQRSIPDGMVYESASSQRLEAIHDRAFALIREGKLDQANSFLAGPEYQREKEANSERLAALAEAAKSRQRQQISSEDREQADVTLVQVLGSVLVILLWVLAFLKMTAAWRRSTAEMAKIQHRFEEERDYFQAMFHAIGTGVLLIDAETHEIADVNQAAARMIGAPPEAIIGRVCHRFICPAEVGKCPITDLGHEIDHSERTFLNADGNQVPCLKTVVPIELGGRGYLLDCFVDIAEQKRMEAELVRARAEQQAILDNVEIGIAVIGRDLRLLSVNRRMREWFPKIDSSKGPICYEAYNDPPREQPCSYCPTIKTLQDGQVHESVTETPTPNGIVNYRIVSSPILDKRGRVIAAIEMVDDITTRMRYEEELRKAKSLAERATKAKSEFLANMSHEIRTPMTSVLGYAELLSESIECCDVCPEHKKCETRIENLEHIGAICTSGKHLLSVINDVLDLSKIEAGKINLEIKPCDLTSLIADVASMMRLRAEENGLRLITEFPTELPETIQADRGRLRQAIVNLVGNAIKFTKTGSVTIRVAFLPSWRDGTPAVSVTIVDTGVGIDPEALERIFEPFEQADASTTRRYGGTGLGLSITRRIVEAFGGELTAESKSGDGSSFRVTVPTGSLDGVRMLSDPGEALAVGTGGESKTEEVDCDLQDRRILLAEDSDINSRLIGAVLRKAGAHVEIVCNGKEALDALDRGHFDVVLMDVQMPELDGYAATRALRTRQYTGPIIALTANAMDGDREKCLAAG